MVETWVAFAVVTVILTGISGLFSKISLNNVPSSVLVLSSFIVIMPISLILLAYYVTSVGLGGVSLYHLALGIVAAVFANLGFFCYFDALEKGPLMLIGSLTSTYPAIVIVGAILLLREWLTLVQAIGAIMVICGLISLLYIHGTATGKVKIPRIAIILSILAIISWSIWGLTFKTALEGLDIILFWGMSTLVMPPLTLGYLKLRGKGQRIRLPKYSVPFVLAIISVEIEQLGFYFETLSVNYGPASLVFPVIASYPVVTLIVAYLFLKERLSLKEVLLIFAVVTGIVLVSVI